MAPSLLAKSEAKSAHVLQQLRPLVTPRLRTRRTIRRVVCRSTCTFTCDHMNGRCIAHQSALASGRRRAEGCSASSGGFSLHDSGGCLFCPAHVRTDLQYCMHMRCHKALLNAPSTAYSLSAGERSTSGLDTAQFDQVTRTILSASNCYLSARVWKARTLCYIAISCLMSCWKLFYSCRIHVKQSCLQKESSAGAHHIL